MISQSPQKILFVETAADFVLRLVSYAVVAFGGCLVLAFALTAVCGVV